MNLDVLIPSLFLPAQLHTQFPAPVVPALERMLARAGRQAEFAAAGSSWLCDRWGVAAPYAIARLLAEFDGLDASDDGWLFAEPVHLIANRDRLTMFPTGYLDVSATEAAELVFALNIHFSDRHLQFCSPVPAFGPQRWYVRCAPSEIPETTSISAARTGSLADFQPKSRGSLDWRSLQNEVQMLFFRHPVNERREAEGKPTISGVWFWGGGVLSGLKRPPYDCVTSISPLATQLARKTDMDVHPMAWDSIQSVRGDVLAVIETCAPLAHDRDFPAWTRELERLDREWFLPVSQALAKGTIQRLNIHVPDGKCTQSFHITRRNLLLRFWRAAKPLSTYA